MSYIKPDRIFTVPIADGELYVSPATDFLHYFRPLGVYMLKYWDLDNEPPRLCNVMMGEESAKWLMDKCDVECFDRKSIGEQEHEQLIHWQASELESSGLDFEPELPE